MKLLDSWQQAGPLDRSVIDRTIGLVQERLDLLAVLRYRYDQDVSESGERWRTTCFLPSLVSDFEGSCADQDASEGGGEVPRNLWVSEGDSTLVWRCHSCGRRGDVIDLIEHADGLPKTTQMISLRAVRAAAKLAGVMWCLDDHKPTEADDPDELMVIDQPRKAAPRITAHVHRDVAARLNAYAAKFWNAHLLSPAGEKARTQLYSRGITDDQIARYHLGYAPAKWRELVPKIKKAKHADAVTLGLLGRNREGNLYDRQRDRLIFPYVDVTHAGLPAIVSGFAGRKLSDDEKAPKWLNSSNVSGVWEKRSQFFGLYQAAEKAREHNRVAVVEGAGDALAYERAGLPAIALVSAEFTTEHADVLARVLGVERVLLALDGDESGRKGALKAATVLLRAGFGYDAIEITDPGDGKDPELLSAEDLQGGWDDALSVATFALGHGRLLSGAQQVALIAAIEDAGQAARASVLRQEWGIDAAVVEAKRARELVPKTAVQELAVLLSETPGVAVHIGDADAQDILDADALARQRVKHLTFSDAPTDTAALPASVRAAWFHACHERYVEKLAVHEATDPFAAGESHDAFRKWHNEGTRLRKALAHTLRELAQARDSG